MELGLSGLNFLDALKHVAQAARLELAFAMEANALVKQLKHKFVILKNAKLVNHFYKMFVSDFLPSNCSSKNKILSTLYEKF